MKKKNKIVLLMALVTVALLILGGGIIKLILLNKPEDKVVVDTITSFADMDQNSADLKVARSAVGYGLFTADDQERFLPDETINRAEFARLLTRVMALEYSLTLQPSYGDVDIDHPDYESIEAAGPLINCSVSSSGMKLFMPDGEISHKEALLALGQLVSPGSDSFDWLEKIGISSDDALLSQPDTSMTRVAAARLFSNVINSRLETIADDFQIISIK
ncbi:MAG: hypothetical protein R6W99_09935 [Clostridia bacterium]